MSNDLELTNFTVITVPGGSFTGATKVSNNGEVVGFYGINGETHGFYLSNGKFIDIHGSVDNQVLGINALGVLVGAAIGGSSAFSYSGGSFHAVTVTHVGTLSTIEAQDINDAGQIVGDFSDGSGNHGFILQGGATTQLDGPGADRTFALGNNNVGQVVGFYQLGGPGHGFVYDSTNGMTDFDVPGAAFTTPGDINDWGQIAGTYFDFDGHSHGFVFADGQYYTIEVPDGFGADPGSIQITGINNLGQVSGQYQIGGFASGEGFVTLLAEYFTYDVSHLDHPDATAPFGTEIRNSNVHGFTVGRYVDDGGFINSFVGGVGSNDVTIITFAEAVGGVDARDINDPGQVAGNYLDVGGQQHGFIGTDVDNENISITTLDDPNADAGTTEVMGMDNAGQVIGTYSVGGVQHAFVWSSDAGYTDLDLSGAGAGSNAFVALDINDFGQIVGSYRDSASGKFHGFLLDDGEFTAIKVPGGLGTGVSSINNAGQIAGFYMGLDAHFHPFVLSGGAYSTVDLPDSGGAYGISNNGTVAGSDNDGATHHGFVAEISGASLQAPPPPPPPPINKAVWDHGVDGNFDDPSKWLSGSLPDAGSVVLITRQTDFTVTMDSDRTINKLRVGTADFDGATLAVHDATLKVTGGYIDVPGTLTLDSFTGDGASLLLGRSTIILGGCGCEPDIAMGLSGHAGPISIGIAAGVASVVRLDNAGAYIAGQGHIGDAMMQLINEGRIEAQGGTLTVDTGIHRIFNAGELDVTAGSTLNVESAVSNIGQIFADDDSDAGIATLVLDDGLENFGTLDAGFGSTVYINGSVKNYGGIFSDGALTISENVFNDANGGIIAYSGSIDIVGNLNNQGYFASGGSVLVQGLVKNSGTLLAGAGGSLMVGALQGDATILDDGIIDIVGSALRSHIEFQGDEGGLLILQDHAAFRGGDISGFDDSDRILLQDLLRDIDTRLAYNESTGVLRVVEHDGGVKAKLSFVGSYTQSDFALADDGFGHVVIQHHDSSTLI